MVLLATTVDEEAMRSTAFLGKAVCVQSGGFFRTFHSHLLASYG